MAYTLGLDGEVEAQVHDDIPLLYGAVAQISAARQAAISAGLASHSAQPPALMHPQATQEARQLGDAIARAYKTDALRDLQRQQQASAPPQASGAGAALPRQQHTASRAQSSTTASEGGDRRGNAESSPGSIGAQGRLGQPVSTAADEEQQESSGGGSYDDDEFSDDGSGA